MEPARRNDSDASRPFAQGLSVAGWCVLAGFVLRLLVAYVNAYHGPVPGASGDAVGFHDIAAAFSRHLTTNHFVFGVLYAYALGVFYWATYPSLFLGSALSAVAWLASAVLALRVMRLLSCGRVQRAKAMIVYAVLPSSILLTGVTLREAYQLLLVNVVIYASLRVYYRNALGPWITLLVAALAGGMLQPGLFAFGVFMVAATLAWSLYRRRSRLARRQVGVVLATAAVVVLCGYAGFLQVYSFDVRNGLGATIESYQRGGLSIPARTHYKHSVAIGGLADLLLLIPAGLFQYLFEPMPWRDLQPVDVPVVLENVLRVLLLWTAGTSLWRLPSDARRPVALIFLGYLVLETMFSLGTVNWGTSARHHVPSLALLLVTAFSHPRRRAPAPAVAPVPLGSPTRSSLAYGASASA